MSSLTLQKWVVCRQPCPEASIRLFCAAWAGGSASVFNKWPSSLSGEVELVAIQLPGRMSRISEDYLTSILAIVENIAEALITLGLLDKPCAFFGHSMGALVMYELAHRLARDTRAVPRFLIVSGCRPPNMWVGGLSPPVSKLPRDELVDHLLGLGGLPAELKDQRALLDRFLPAIRADYAALEVFEPDLGRAPLDCPVVCFGGMDDRGASPDDLANWATFTTGGFQFHMFPGGHFFLKDDGEPAVVAKLSEVLTAR